MAPTWCYFQDIHADAEAACVSSSSMFSLSSLEVTFDPGYSGFALTERKQHDIWRWALVSAAGPTVDEGWEPTESDAKRSAVGAMRRAMARGLDSEMRTAASHPGNGDRAAVLSIVCVGAPESGPDSDCNPL
jgi:hypothetical protein